MLSRSKDTGCPIENLAISCASLPPVEQPLFSHVRRTSSKEETLQSLNMREVNLVERPFVSSSHLVSLINKLDRPLRERVGRNNGGFEHGEPRDFFSCTFYPKLANPTLNGSFFREVSISREEETALKEALTELIAPLQDRYPGQIHRVHLGLLMSITSSQQTGHPAHTDYDSIERAMWYPNTNDDALHVPDHESTLFDRKALFQAEDPETELSGLPIYRGKGGNFFYIKCEHTLDGEPLVHWSPPERRRSALYFRSRVLSEKFRAR